MGVPVYRTASTVLQYTDISVYRYTPNTARDFSRPIFGPNMGPVANAFPNFKPNFLKNIDKYSQSRQAYVKTELSTTVRKVFEIK